MESTARLRLKNVGFIIVPMNLPKQTSPEKRRKLAQKRISNKIHPTKPQLIKKAMANTAAMDVETEKNRTPPKTPPDTTMTDASREGSPEAKALQASKELKRKRGDADDEEEDDRPRKKARVVSDQLMQYLWRGVGEFSGKIKNLDAEITALHQIPLPAEGEARADVNNHILAKKEEQAEYKAALAQLRSIIDNHE